MIIIEEHKLEFQEGEFKVAVPQDAEIQGLRVVNGAPVLFAEVDKEDELDEDNHSTFQWLQGNAKVPDCATHEGAVEDGGQLRHLYRLSDY